MSLHHSHNKPFSSVLPLTLVFIVILGAGLYWHFSEVSRLEKQISQFGREESPSVPSDTSNENPPLPNDAETKSYSNETYDYTLRYPSHLNLTTYTAAKSVIGSGNLSQGEVANDQVTITVLEAKTTAEKKLSVQDFIESRVKLLCDANGGGVSVTCPKQKSLEPLTLASGLSAYTLTLERQEKTIGPEASVVTDETVFFVTDISGDSETKLLVIYPIGEGTPELARTIIETVSLVK